MMINSPFVLFGLISAGLFMLVSIPVELGFVSARPIDFTAVVDLRFLAFKRRFQDCQSLLLAETAVP